MDAAFRNPTRRFPCHTDAELRQALTREDLPADKREAMTTELTAREAGTSVAFRAPQVSGGTPIFKVGRM